MTLKNPIDGKELYPQNVLAVSSLSRPKRVTFLVHPSEVSDAEIDAIILYCTKVWCGRFNAIIITDGVDIKDAWWELLVAVDPDVIYSFVSLDDVLIRRINKYILPGKIIEVSNDSEPTSRPIVIDTFDVNALGVEDIPRFFASKRTPIFARDPFFFNIKDSGGDESNKRFLIHNFGVLPGIISTDQAFHELPHEDIMTDTAVPAAVVEKMLSCSGSVVTPIDICQLYKLRNYRSDFDSFAQGFHLVIGDSPQDRIYAWNRTLLVETGIGKNVFWLSKDLALDESLLENVCKWINKTYWSEHKAVKVISYSIEQDTLDELAEKVRGFSRLRCDIAKLEVDSVSFPKFYPTRLFHENPLFAEHSYIHTEQVSLSEDDKCLVRYLRPPFLAEESPQFGWMVDLQIQHRPEQYAYTNARPFWQLPKNLGIAVLFFESGALCRVVNGGLPSTAVKTATKPIKVQIPPDFSLIWTYLNKHRYTNIQPRRTLPPPRFKDLKVSDKGSYLQGMLRLFGNIYYAGNAFADPFWRDIFLKMAGRPDPKGDHARRKAISTDILQVILKEDAIPIEANSDRIDVIAEELASRLLFRDRKTKPLTLKNIRDYFGKMRGKALAGPDCQDKDWWVANKKFNEWEKFYLNNFLDSKVLLQGVNLSCPTCKTRDFHVVDDLKAEIRCNGCLYEFYLMPSPEWSFKLNDLVINALKKHGTLAVLQALYSLHQNLMGGMFVFLPCLDIYEDDNKLFTDLDVVVVCNGKLYIGEVKSDPKGFTKKDFAKIKEVAEELLPDEVIIAAPGDSWPDDFLEELAKLTEALKPCYVNVSACLLRW